MSLHVHNAVLNVLVNVNVLAVLLQRRPFRQRRSKLLNLFFTRDASTDANTITLISSCKWPRSRQMHRHNIFPFSRACAYACVCAATTEDHISLRPNTIKGIFTTRGYVWPMKTLDPDFIAPQQLERFRWFCLCRMLLSLGSSPFFVFVLAIVLPSVVKEKKNNSFNLFPRYFEDVTLEVGVDMDNFHQSSHLSRGTYTFGSSFTVSRMSDSLLLL